MSIIGHIRLVGDHHATHHHGAQLMVTDNAAASHPDMVHIDHAEQLVARGEAEWVSRSRGPRPETEEQQASRHALEHGALLAKHRKQHRDMVDRHRAEDTAMRNKAADAVATVSNIAAALRSLQGVVNGTHS